MFEYQTHVLEVENTVLERENKVLEHENKVLEREHRVLEARTHCFRRPTTTFSRLENSVFEDRTKKQNQSFRELDSVSPPLAEDGERKLQLAKNGFDLRAYGT